MLGASLARTPSCASLPEGELISRDVAKHVIHGEASHGSAKAIQYRHYYRLVFSWSRSDPCIPCHLSPIDLLAGTGRLCHQVLRFHDPPCLLPLRCENLQLACSSAAAEDVAFAASCAAFFSKARNEGKVPVAKARVSDLSKPTGAAPGKACPAPLSLYVRCGLCLQLPYVILTPQLLPVHRHAHVRAASCGSFHQGMVCR